MATGITAWSQTAASNANASANINFAEGQAPSSLNDSCRALMSEVKKFVDDLSAVQPANVIQTSGGTANAQTLTTNGSSQSLLNGWTLSFKAGATNTGACTLNVDALGAIAIQAIAGTALGGNEIVAGRIYRVTYSQPNNSWLLHTAASVPAFDAGTLMLFQQTSAPTGWTKQVTHNDKALRVVSGAAASGGTTAFSTIFAARTVTQANLPAVNLSNSLTAATHTHTFSATTGGVSAFHTHAVSGNTSSAIVSVTTNNNSAGGGANNIVNTASAGAPSFSVTSGTDSVNHTHNVSGTTDLSGALAVTGTVSLGGSGTAMDFAVQYVDLIIASKN